MIIVFLSGGCPAIWPKVTYQSFGDANPDRDEAMVKRWKNKYKQLDASRVRLLLDTIPEGIEVKDGVAHTKQGYSHVVISKFRFLYPPGMATLFFYDYRTAGLKALCWWQVPLSYLTLAAWLVVPTSWACFPPISVTKRVIIRDAKKLAAAVGGDLVLARYIGDEGGDSAKGMAGVVVRMDPRFKQRRLPTKPLPRVSPRSPQLF